MFSLFLGGVSIFILYVTSSEANNTLTDETVPGLGWRCSCLSNHLFKFIQMGLAQLCHYLPLDAVPSVFHSYARTVDRTHCFFGTVCTDFLAWKVANCSVDLAHGYFNIKTFGRHSMSANGIYDRLRSLGWACLLTDMCTSFAHLHNEMLLSTVTHTQRFTICIGHPGTAEEVCFLCNRSRAVTADGLAGRFVMSIQLSEYHFVTPAFPVHPKPTDGSTLKDTCT